MRADDVLNLAKDTSLPSKNEKRHGVDSKIARYVENCHFSNQEKRQSRAALEHANQTQKFISARIVGKWERAMQCGSGILIAAIFAAQAASGIYSMADKGMTAELDKMTICQPRKPKDAREWWRFRLIDGKQCWFRGHASMPKAQLRWEHIDDRPVPVADNPDSGTAAEPVAADESVPVTTMRIRPGTAFEWMWRGLMVDMNARAWMDPMRMENWHVF